MTIKIAVTWSCGHTDEYTTNENFDVPKSWKRFIEVKDDIPPICSQRLSEKDAEALR